MDFTHEKGICLNSAQVALCTFIDFIVEKYIVLMLIKNQKNGDERPARNKRTCKDKSKANE